MRTVELKIYQYSELSDEAKQKARDWYKEGLEYFDNQAQENTLNSFCQLFNLKVKNWQINLWGHSFCDIETNQSDEVNNLTGIRLYKYIVNNAYETLFKRKYLKHFATSEAPKNHRMLKCELIKGKGPNAGKYFISAYANTIRQAENCNLTGWCFDENILAPVYQFLKSPNNNVTFENLMQECANEWALGYKKDYEYQLSDECVEEIILANEYEFDVLGNKF